MFSIVNLQKIHAVKDLFRAPFEASEVYLTSGMNGARVWVNESGAAEDYTMHFRKMN
jgi:hypothetical protein